jgi:hypothetical protein
MKGLSMKRSSACLCFALLFSGQLLAGAWAAEEKTALPAPLTDSERIDSLIRQNQILLSENTRLARLPRTKEEMFVSCMQAAKGQTSAMAAESIGGHCSKLLAPGADSVKGQ